MILRQFLHTDPVIAASYLVGCGGKGASAIVDPVEPPDFYAAMVRDIPQPPPDAAATRAANLGVLPVHA